MATTQPWLRSVFGLQGPIELWWGIQPISAGVFGVPVGFAVMVLVSWMTPAPSAEVSALIDRIRGIQPPSSYPRQPSVDKIAI
jgi:cation/acetate symporter